MQISVFGIVGNNYLRCTH